MTTEHDVVRGLARLAAERCLVALETSADRHGTAAHIFPSMGNEEPHEVTVTWCNKDNVQHYDYRLRVPACPGAGGVIDRATALRIIASDKQLLAADKAIRALQ